MFGRPGQQLHNLREQSDGSRTVSLLALERLEFAFGFLLIDLPGRRKEVKILPPPDTTVAATRKGGEVCHLRQIMAPGQFNTSRYA